MLLIFEKEQKHSLDETLGNVFKPMYLNNQICAYINEGKKKQKKHNKTKQKPLPSIKSNSVE